MAPIGTYVHGNNIYHVIKIENDINYCGHRAT